MVLLTLRAFLGGLYTSTTVLRVFFSIIQKVLAISKRNFVPQNQIYEQKFWKKNLLYLLYLFYLHSYNSCLCIALNTEKNKLIIIWLLHTLCTWNLDHSYMLRKKWLVMILRPWLAYLAIYGPELCQWSLTLPTLNIIF